MPVAPNLSTGHQDNVGEIIHANDIDDIAFSVNVQAAGKFIDVFGGALDHAFDPEPAVPTAPTMTSIAQANGYNVPTCVSILKENPPTTLQAQVTAAPSGSVLTITPGYIYREAVTVNKPLTIKGGFAASLRGSDDWSTGGGAGNTWTAGTGIWTSSLTIPAMSTDSTQGAPTDTYSQNHRETIFSDGVGVPLVNATPSGNQWQIDGTRHVVLGFNPAGHKIEVATRGAVISLTTNSAFSVDGLDIRECATSGVGVPAVIDSSGVTTASMRISNCMIGWCHGAGLNLGAMTNMLVRDTLFHDCGTVGLAGSSGSYGRVWRCVFWNNGLPLYGWDPGFSSGGAKIAGTDSPVYDSNVSFANQGVGLWYDVLVTRGVLRRNVCWDNYLLSGAGFNISYEVSSFGVIRDNVVFRTPSQPGGLSNTDLGIFVSNSRWVDVFGNLVMHCPINMKMYWAGSRTDSPPSGSQDNTHMGGITVHGNRVIGRYQANTISGVTNCSDLAIYWSDDASSPNKGQYTTSVTSNTGGVITNSGITVADGNVYGWPALVNNGASFFEAQQEPDSRWWYDLTSSVVQVTTIANWQANLSGRLGQNSRYMSDADRVALLARFGLQP